MLPVKGYIVLYSRVHYKDVCPENCFLTFYTCALAVCVFLIDDRPRELFIAIKRKGELVQT